MMSQLLVVNRSLVSICHSRGLHTNSISSPVVSAKISCKTFVLVEQLRSSATHNGQSDINGARC